MFHETCSTRVCYAYQVITKMHLLLWLTVKQFENHYTSDLFLHNSFLSKGKRAICLLDYEKKEKKAPHMAISGDLSFGTLCSQNTRAFCKTTFCKWPPPVEAASSFPALLCGVLVNLGMHTDQQTHWSPGPTSLYNLLYLLVLTVSSDELPASHL